MKKEKPKFFSFYKEFNGGKIVVFDVFNYIFRDIENDKGRINKKALKIWDDSGKRKDVKTKEDLEKFVTGFLRYHFSSKCEWEFIAVDWPYRDDSVENSRPVKIDVYEMLEPNIPLITSMLWDYLGGKL